LELDWEQEHLKEGKYTLEMTRIDHAIKEIITQIKLEEARLDDLEIKIAEVRPEVSVAT
jgi:septation ring formation regulator EzrA